VVLSCWNSHEAVTVTEEHWAGGKAKVGESVSSRHSSSTVLHQLISRIWALDDQVTVAELRLGMIYSSILFGLSTMEVIWCRS
jgi:hypothetical protein